MVSRMPDDLLPSNQAVWQQQDEHEESHSQELGQEEAPAPEPTFNRWKDIPKPKSGFRRARSKGELDMSSSSGRKSYQKQGRSNSDPNFLLNYSSHSSQSGGASIGSFTRAERSHSHRRLNEVRKQQAERRRYHAASQSPKTPTRRRDSWEDGKAEPAAVSAPTFRKTFSLTDVAPQPGLRKESTHTTYKDVHPSAYDHFDNDHHQQSNAMNRPRYDSMPRPGIRKESSHTQRSSAGLPVSAPPFNRNGSYDSIPKPGLRKASHHSSVATPAHTYDSSHQGDVIAERNNSFGHSPRQFDRRPQPGIRKESYHTHLSSRHELEQELEARVPRRSRHIRDPGPRSPRYPDERERKPPSYPNRRTSNTAHDIFNAVDPPPLNYSSSNPSSSDRRSSGSSNPSSSHNPSSYQLQPTSRNNRRYNNNNSNYGDSMRMSISGMTVVSDITDGHSVGDDSLPIWGDYIDEMTVEPRSQLPPMFERSATWAGHDNDLSSHYSNAGSGAAERDAELTRMSPRHSTPPRPTTTIEVQPGVNLPLRGKDETLQAIACNFSLQTICMVCSLELACIADAEYVLCPVCKSISPIDSNTGNGGGVGLGSTQLAK